MSRRCENCKIGQRNVNLAFCSVLCANQYNGCRPTIVNLHHTPIRTLVPMRQSHVFSNDNNNYPVIIVDINNNCMYNNNQCINCRCRSKNYPYDFCSKRCAIVYHNRF